MKERLEMVEAQLHMSISGDRNLTVEVVDLQAINVELVTRGRPCRWRWAS